MTYLTATPSSIRFYTTKSTGSSAVFTGSSARNYCSESLYRSIKIIRELAECNVWQGFFTLTVNQKILPRDDIGVILRRLTTLFDDYRKLVDRDFKFLVIPELHKDGHIHFHGLVSFSDTSNSVFNNPVCGRYYSVNKWFLSHIGANRVEWFNPHFDVQDAIRYSIKYAYKGCENGVFPQVYRCSRGLKRAYRAMILDDDDCDMLMSALSLSVNDSIPWVDVHYNDYGISYYILCVAFVFVQSLLLSLYGLIIPYDYTSYPCSVGL